MIRFNRKSSLLAVFACGIVACATQGAIAQPKPGVGPSSTHIFPAGGQRGSIVDVAVGGECLPPGTRFQLADADGKVSAIESRLTRRVPDDGEPSPRRYPTETPITYPKQWSSRIAIAADAPTGPVYWRLACAQGGTCSRPFVVGDLPEIIERESNSTCATANSIELPATVNGQISGERDVDCFRFSARAGDVISCEMLARRLGSPLDPNLSIVDHRGRDLPTTHRYLGSDFVVAAAIRESGDFYLRVSNISLRGDPSYVYRLNVSRKPFVFACFPAGARAGAKRELTFLAMSGEDTPTAITREMTFPDRVRGAFVYRSSWFANEVALALENVPDARESEPNDQRSACSSIAIPSAVDGRFQSKRDVDWYCFEARQGERLSLVCQTRPFSSSALPRLALFNDQGEPLAASSRDAPGEDCRVEWQSPASGTYWIRLRDLRHGSQGGLDFIYRLVVRRAAPDFSLVLPQDCVNVELGKTTEMDVKAKRFGGFSDAIELQVTGLPDGVTCEGTTIAANKNATKLQFKAGGDAGASDAVLKVTGRARIGNVDVERAVRARHMGVDGEGASCRSATVEQLTLTVNHKPAFRLFCSEAYQYAHRGSVFLYPMQVERLNGFQGEITLQIGDRQNRDLDGIEMFEVTIPANESETLLPIYLPETMHINVQSQSQLYSQGYATFKDKLDRQQAVLVLAEKRNMLRTLPPVVKLQARDETLHVTVPSETTFRLRLERTRNFEGPMRIRLTEPRCKAISAHEIEIPAGAVEGEMVARISADWQPSGESTRFRFRATGVMDNGTQLISETSVAVVR